VRRPIEVERTTATRAGVAIVLGVLVLLPFGRLAELPVAIGVLVTLVLAVRGRLWAPGDDAQRLVVLLFLAYAVPIALSGFASVAADKTWSTALASLRHLGFALFAVHVLRRPQAQAAVVPAVAAVTLLWILDAWVQYLTGHSIGGAPEAERLSGIFGADNIKLGPVLAALSPFVLLAARARFGRSGLLLAFLLVLVPVLLSGSRAAWLSYALVSVVVAWHETGGSLRRFAPLLVGVGLAFVMAAAGMRFDSSGFQSRIERSLLAVEGTPQALDEAAAGRLSIWRTAIDMIRAHPLTGVGARGFRYDYPEHAAPGDRFVVEGSREGASHAHQIVLEVLSETGIVGLLGWIVGAVAAVRAWRRADRAARARAYAPALALVAMCFPLNTHLAFYSAWWGLFFWWLLALYCAALAAPREPSVRPLPA